MSFEDWLSDFSHWRFIQEIFPFSWRFVHGDLFRRFFLLWRCVHGDLSIEDWSVGDLSLFKDLFIEIYPLKIYSGNFSFYSWRFIHWRLKCRRFVPFRRFVHRDFSFEDLFRRFFLLWRCVHGDLSIEDWSEGDLSLFEDLFMKICHLKIWIGDLSLKDLFMVICHLKICSGDFSFWNFE